MPMIDRSATVERIKILEELKLRRSETRLERLWRRLAAARERGALSVPGNLTEVLNKARKLRMSCEDKIARGIALSDEEKAFQKRSEELHAELEEHTKALARRAAKAAEGRALEQKLASTPVQGLLPH
jgi:hypothetical protein